MATAADIDVIGREEELSALFAFLEAVEDLPGAVVLEGEAGAGKTTLFEAGVAGAQERSYRILAARPAASETQLSFAGLRDILEEAFGVVSERLPAPQRLALDVALLRQDPGGTPPDSGAVAAGFLSVLGEFAREAPVLLAVDDLQWLDEPSVRVLLFAARRLRNKRIGLLITRRSDAAEFGRGRFEDDLPGQRSTRIRIGPLSLGALHLLLRDRLGFSLTRPVLRRVHQGSAGNPFFALEIARALQRRGGRLESGEALPLPDDLRDLVRERLRTLPRPTREALLSVASLSAPTVDLVNAAVPGDLEPAIAAHVIERDGDRIRFTHPLLAASVYSDAPPSKRRQIHRCLADLIVDPEERARHLALAASEPDETVATTLEEAARKALSRGAISGAAELTEQARRLTSPDRIEELRRRSGAEAEYRMRAGEVDRARTILEEVLVTCPAGPTRAKFLGQLADVHLWGLDCRSSADLHQKALREAGPDLAVRAKSELGLGRALLFLRQPVREIAGHARAATALAERLDDPVLLAEALALQAEAELLLGHGFQTQLIEQARSLEGLRSGQYLALMLCWIDELDRSLAVYEEVRTIAADHGDEASLAWILGRMAQAECLAGAWDEALRHIKAGEELVMQTGQIGDEALLLASRALVEAHLGRTRSAREAGWRALELAEITGDAIPRRIALWALGFLELSLRRAEEAHLLLGPLLEESRAAGIVEPGEMRFLSDEIEALIGLGRYAEAEEALSFFEKCAQATNRASALAISGRCRGILLMALGSDTSGAVARLREALRGHEHVPMPFERGRTLLTLGQVYRRGKQKRAARDALGESRAVFEELGAKLWAERARAELARIGGRPLSGGLTATEYRLAELVATGRSNKEAAAALFVTPKTVETKLSRMYAKLGVHSRTELAHWVTEESGASKQ